MYPMYRAPAEFQKLETNLKDRYRRKQERTQLLT